MRRAIDILKREDGASIIFACVVLCVLLILGGIIVAYGFSNYSRAVNNHAEQDDYEYVLQATRSVRDNIASNYDGESGSSKGWARELLSMNGSKALISYEQEDGSGSGDFGYVTAVCEYGSDSGLGRYCTITCYQSDASMNIKQTGIALCFDVQVTEDGVVLDPLADQAGIRKAGQ